MAFNVNVSEDNSKAWINGMVGDMGEAEERILKKSGKAIKGNVRINLKRSKINCPDYKHMVDDIQESTYKNKYGNKTTRVRGGKKTGRKWHLLNDGTYKMDATHFMDKALMDSEEEINSIIDEELRGIFND